MSEVDESWVAQETTNFAGSDRKITVTGTVQTTNSNQEPELVGGVSGANPTILLLDLKFPSQGVGNTVIGTRQVKFQKPVDEKQYSQVTIRRESGSDVTIDVEVIHS